jgi:hypothetical protein
MEMCRGRPTTAAGENERHPHARWEDTRFAIGQLEQVEVNKREGVGRK